MSVAARTQKPPRVGHEEGHVEEGSGGDGANPASEAKPDVASQSSPQGGKPQHGGEQERAPDCVASDAPDGKDEEREHHQEGRPPAEGEDLQAEFASIDAASVPLPQVLP